MKFPAYLRPDRVSPGVQPEPTTPADEPAVMRFLTLGGAIVAVQPTTLQHYREHGDDGPVEWFPVPGHRWDCLGCDMGGTSSDTDSVEVAARSSLNQCRKAANEHAEKCRAMPKPEGNR